MLFPVAGIELHPLLPPAIGLGVGVLSGIFGVGGGFLVTPILLWIGVPAERAVGSELNQIVAASSSGSVLKARLGNVSWRLGLLVAAGGVPAALAGTLVVHELLEEGSFDGVLKVLYTVLLVGIGLRMVTELRPRGEPPAPSEEALEWEVTRSRAIGAVCVGMVAGALSAFLGVGGGVMLVPAMIYILGAPTRIAVGTSLLQVLAISLAATVFHAVANGDVDMVLAALLMSGSIPGSWIGVWLGAKLKAHSIKGVFGAVVLLAALRMGWGLVSGEGSDPVADGVPEGAVMPWLGEWALSASLGMRLLYGLAAVGGALAAGLTLGLVVRGRICGPAVSPEETDSRGVARGVRASEEPSGQASRRGRGPFSG